MYVETSRGRLGYFSRKGGHSGVDEERYAEDTFIFRIWRVRCVTDA